MLVDKSTLSNFGRLPMDDSVVSKRLIISGLTPAIDPEALSKRLSNFGTVHSLTGVGRLDANGKTTEFLNYPEDLNIHLLIFE